MTEQCDVCRFWEPGYRTTEYGWCHRLPPTRVDDNTSAWPETFHQWWCGEFKPREPQNLREAVAQARAGYVEPSD